MAENEEDEDSPTKRRTQSPSARTTYPIPKLHDNGKRDYD